MPPRDKNTESYSCFNGKTFLDLGIYFTVRKKRKCCRGADHDESTGVKEDSRHDAKGVLIIYQSYDMTVSFRVLRIYFTDIY